MIDTRYDEPALVAPGTAVRDAALALGFAVVVCALAAGSSLASPIGVAAVATGLGVVAAAGFSVVNRPFRWSGPADRVSLLRVALIGGCTTVALLVAAGERPERPWPLVVLLVPALLLDTVDGRVARWTGTSSAAGGRLDGELDAALLMALSVGAVRALGVWVLAIGVMRYGFWLVGRLRGWRPELLRYSEFRRAVAALQGVAFAVALAPVVPPDAGWACVAAALAALAVSFGRDVETLEKQR